MMQIEKFREELFAKLLAARTKRHPRMISIGCELFSQPIEDMTEYMDSEMRHLVTVYPYRMSYVSCESDKDHLMFIDIIPEVRDVNGIIEQRFYYYDCENHQVTSFVQYIEP